MTMSLLEQVVRKRASLAIIDLTGMRGVGGEVIDHIVRMARCVKLLGASCGVSGVRPEVARAVIELGSELGDVRSYPTLRAALTDYVGGLLKSKRRSSAATAAR
jgi:rsbT co-antagonist protein RsbR